MEKREDLLRGAIKILQPDAKDGLRVNIDTILLAHFTKPKNGEKILEFGCAHGAISLILAGRGYDVEGIDIQPKLVEMAEDNAKYNNLNAKFRVADLRNYKQIAPSQTYDRIVVNPPYYEADKSSGISPSKALATALQGTECKLSNVIDSAHYLLKNKGKLDIIMTAGRTAELLQLLEEKNISAKTVKFVYPKPDCEASVVLVEAMRAAKKGTKVLAPLFVLDENGVETAEMLENYKL